MEIEVGRKNDPYTRRLGIDTAPRQRLLQFLQPRVRHLGVGKGPAFASSSGRPVPSAPRPSPACRPRYSVCKLLSPASSFSPASVTCVHVKVQRLQALEPGQFLQPRVRHLACCQGPAFASSSARPAPSAPRPSPCVSVKDTAFASSSARPAPSAPRPSPGVAKVQRLQALQPGQLLQPRVRHLGAAKVAAFASSSARPAPSAPRPSPWCA